LRSKVPAGTKKYPFQKSESSDFLNWNEYNKAIHAVAGKYNIIFLSFEQEIDQDMSPAKSRVNAILIYYLCSCIGPGIENIKVSA